MGIGWQELVIIGIMLIMCIAILAPVVAVLVLVRRRRAAVQEREIAATPPARRPDPYATRYGFDDTDWQSDDEDDRHMASRTGAGSRS